MLQVSVPSEIHSENASFVRNGAKSLETKLTKRENKNLFVFEPVSINLQTSENDDSTTMVRLTKESTIAEKNWNPLSRPRLRLFGISDAITAFYFPLDQLLTRVELIVNDLTCREWTLIDGEWHTNDVLGDELEMASFRCDYLNGNATADKMRSELEMDRVNLKCALAFSHLQISHAEPYVRGQYLTTQGCRFQRCAPMDPCLPGSPLYSSTMELRFDANTELFIERCHLDYRIRSSWCNPNNFCVKGMRQSHAKESGYFMMTKEGYLQPSRSSIDEIERLSSPE